MIRIACAAAGAALILQAQAAGPADPAAPVPRTLYRSVFQDTPTGVEQQQDDWKKANAEVGQFRRGHVDLLKWEEAQQPAPATAPPAAQPPAHRH